jgi:flagellum-specific peptidoglycan hydrolase FlgJ
MACGIVKLTGVPGDRIGMAEQDALSDGASKTVREDAGNGLWNLTAFYDPCTTGDPNPITTQSLPSGQPKVTGSATTTPGAFITSHLAAAQQVKIRFSVPIAVTLAQSALETGWGMHVVANAYFGIKAGAGQPCVTATTGEVVDGQPVTNQANFCSYDSFDDAAMDYGQFLRNNPRYHLAFAHTDNPEAFAQAVADAGYATDPNYGTKLVTIMRSNGLEQYDRV